MKFSKALFTATLATSVVMLSACGKEKAAQNKQAQQDARPQQLNFANPEIGAELTSSQIEQLKSTFKRENVMELPPTALLKKDPDAKLDEMELLDLKAEEQFLQYTSSAETYALYKEMRAHCRKQRGNLNLDMSFPMEKVTQASELKTGDHMLSRAWASYNGAKCAVDTEGKITYSAKVDRMETDGIISAEASYSLKALMKNPKYAKLLKSRGIIATSSVNSVVAKQNVNTEDNTGAEGNITFGINGSYFTLTAEIPVNSTYSIYAKAIDNESAEVQMLGRISVKMPTFNAIVEAQITSIAYQEEGKEAEVQSEKYFVNGHEKTKAEIEEMFNDKMISGQANEVVETLMN